MRYTAQYVEASPSSVSDWRIDESLPNSRVQNDLLVTKLFLEVGGSYIALVFTECCGIAKDEVHQTFRLFDFF